MEVGRDEVTLRTGKQANRRTIQFALQALLAVFDTQEAAKSLTLEDSSSLESLDSEPSDTRTTSPPPTTAPTLGYPPWRPVLGNQILGRSSTGAFSTYARTRDEPDGRTATMGSDQKGRESDTFTPSPVDTMKQRGQKQSPQPAPHLAINLSHQSKIRSIYNDSPASDNNATRPNSSSSASSATDWDSGQSTVRRQIISRDIDSVSLKECVSIHAYDDIKKATCNALNDPSKISTSSLIGDHVGLLQSSQASSEFDFSGSNCDLENLSVQIPNFNLSSMSIKDDLKKKSCMFSSIVNKTMSKDFSRKNINRLDPDRNYYRKASTLSHIVETKAQVHQAEITKSYPSSETGIYAPCLEGRTQENIDILEIRVPPTIGCNLHEKSIYVPQAFHNSLNGRKQNSGKQVLNTQLRHLSQELPISDVYHDRNVGLGLAPSLSKILASDNAALADDQHTNENLHTRTINLNGTQKLSRQKPPLPPKRIPLQYNHSHADHRSSIDGILQKGDTIEKCENSVNCGVRGQGDGGSFTDLSCPSQTRDLFPPSLKTFSSFLNNIEDSIITKEAGKKSHTDLQVIENASEFKPNSLSSSESSRNLETKNSLKIDCGNKKLTYYNCEVGSQEPTNVLQKDGWTLDTNRNLCTSSTTSDTEGSDIDNSPKNISTVKRNPKHILSSRSKVPENPS